MAKRYRSERKHEKGWAKEYHLMPTVGSGNSWMGREDAFDEYILVQMKHTKKRSITLKVQDVLDLQEHARLEGKIPLFLVRFGEEDGMEMDLFCVQPQHLLKIAQRFGR